MGRDGSSVVGLTATEAVGVCARVDTLNLGSQTLHAVRSSTSAHWAPKNSGRRAGPDGSIKHAEIKMEDSLIGLGEENERSGRSGGAAGRRPLHGKRQG